MKKEEKILIDKFGKAIIFLFRRAILNPLRIR